MSQRERERDVKRRLTETTAVLEHLAQTVVTICGMVDPPDDAPAALRRQWRRTARHALRSVELLLDRLGDATETAR